MKAGRRTWIDKFRNAFRGIRRALLTQSSFRIHVPVAAVVIGTAGVLGVSALDWCLLVLAIGFVLVAELFNTAIESLARGPGTRSHPRLRDALDIASAAVLFAAATAAVVGLGVLVRNL